MNDDLELLQDYARHDSEKAFAALVARHINLVHSVALSQVRDPLLAEEVTQAVFIVLARKAGTLGPKTVLSGWLCRTAQYVSADALKIRLRRQHREQEAYRQSLMNEPESTSEAWRQIEPLLGAALAGLGEKDHDAIVLRYFEDRDFRDVGRKLGASEDAAKVRVSRALEKLRKFFARRGLTFSAATIAGAMLANPVQAAPSGLAATVTAGAVAKGVSVSSLVLTLVKGALKIMAWTKAKTAIVVGTGMLLAAGTTTLAVKEVSHYRQATSGTTSRALISTS